MPHNSKNIQKILLNWSIPLIPQFIEKLIITQTKDGVLDLADSLIVLRTKRAVRRFLESLLLIAEQKSLRLTPPRTITLDLLGEELLDTQRPKITESESLLCWLEVLRSTPDEELKPLFPKDFSSFSINMQADYASHCSNLLKSLAYNSHTFKSVQEVFQTLDIFDDSDRWEIFSLLGKKYELLITSRELADTNMELIKFNKDSALLKFKNIYLASLPELPPIFENVMPHLAENVFSIVHTNEETSDRFNKFGRLVTKEKVWDINSPEFIVTDSEFSQINSVIYDIHNNITDSKESISIGLLDEKLAKPFETTFKSEDIKAISAASIPWKDSLVSNLLVALSKYIETNSAYDFGTLIRVPEIWNILEQECDIDSFILEYDKLTEKLIPNSVTTLKEKSSLYKDVYSEFDNKFSTIPKEKKNIKELAKLFLDIFQNLLNYKDDLTDHNLLHLRISARDSLINELIFLSSLNSSLELFSSDFLTLLNKLLQKTSIEKAPFNSDIRVLGWLELPFDESDVLYLTSMNEGVVPEKIKENPFILETLRINLGLDSDELRLNVSLYKYAQILNTRKRVVILIPKRDIRGDVLSPSRVLYYNLNNSIPEIVPEFFEKPTSQAPHIWINSEDSNSEIFARKILQQNNSKINITSLAAYKTDPYYYYLSRCLNLRESHDSFIELSASGFGDITHTVLKKFAESEAKDSTDPAYIYSMLVKQLEETIYVKLGTDLNPTVLLQMVSLRERLLSFAKQQAKHRLDGWYIFKSELSINSVRETTTTKKQYELVGRVDRIDKNETSGDILIIDYKTNDSVESPEKKHKRSNEWINFQLPLYRDLILEIPEIANDCKEILTGYYYLPADSSENSIKIAQWSEEDYRTAVLEAEVVVNNILESKFSPESIRNVETVYASLYPPELV